MEGDTPVVVTAVAPFSGTGTGDGGTGSLPKTQELETAPNLPNVVVQVLNPILVIFIRSAKVFLQTLLGLLSAAMVAPEALPAGDFMDLLWKCAGLSVAAAVVAALTNLAEVLSKLDQKFPLITS